MSNLDNYKRFVAAMASRDEGCRGCLRRGGQWVSLRICLSCGYVGCCEDSTHQHARAHAESTGHPLVERYAPALGELV